MRYSKNIKRDKGNIKFLEEKLLEEKLDNYIDNVERMMALILRIPDLVDQSFATVNQKLSILESQIKDLKKKSDFAMAPQVQIHTPLKEKDPEEDIYCQYCGMELTKEEQFTHFCNRFFLG